MFFILSLKKSNAQKPDKNDHWKGLGDGRKGTCWSIKKLFQLKDEYVMNTEYTTWG